MKKLLELTLGTLLITGLSACGSNADDDTDDSMINDQIVMVSGSLTADTNWTADKTYVLTALAFVENNATLTIAAGTKIQGQNGSALIITRGAKLVANGSKEKPVIFTSNSLDGSRRSGDWGGVVLLGAAPINIEGGENRIEGIEATDNRGLYGGSDATHNCGSLKYVRIEFAGFELSIDNELNGLTVGGCGTGTTLDWIQVHKGKDDGVEFFGGTANAKHLVITQAEDDSIDWDQGFSGNLQFVMIQQDPSNADAAFEADNQAENNDASPRSNPAIYNATLVGTNSASGAQRGMVLRRGTWGELRNLIVMGFPICGADIRDAASVSGMQTNPPQLSVQNSLFFENGVNFDADADMDDDGGFDEAAFLSEVAMSNKLDTDPQLAAAYSLTAPNFVPGAGSPAANGAAAAPSGFDEAAYLGAFAPGGENWANGWTAFPEN